MTKSKLLLLHNLISKLFRARTVGSDVFLLQIYLPLFSFNHGIQFNLTESLIKITLILSMQILKIFVIRHACLILLVVWIMQRHTCPVDLHVLHAGSLISKQLLLFPFDFIQSLPGNNIKFVAVKLVRQPIHFQEFLIMFFASVSMQNSVRNIVVGFDEDTFVGHVAVGELGFHSITLQATFILLGYTGMIAPHVNRIGNRRSVIVRIVLLAEESHLRLCQEVSFSYK